MTKLYHVAHQTLTCPTSLSPVFVKATTEGVVRAPSALVTIVGLPPSMAATAEFVVPKSTPTTYVKASGLFRPSDGFVQITTASGALIQHKGFVPRQYIYWILPFMMFTFSALTAKVALLLRVQIWFGVQRLFMLPIIPLDLKGKPLLKWHMCAGRPTCPPRLV